MRLVPNCRASHATLRPCNRSSSWMMCPIWMTSAMMSALFAAAPSRHTGSPQDIKNVDILCPHSEVLRKPMLKDKFAHAKRRHLQLVRLNMIMKFLRFQNVTEQIANAMVYTMLVYSSSLCSCFFVSNSCSKIS